MRSKSLIPATLLCSVWASVASADILWQDWYSANQAISSGDVVTGDGLDVTLGVDVSPSLNLFPGAGGFATYQPTQQGGISNYALLAFDAPTNDPSDTLEFSMDFGRGVQDLEFTIMDIDQGSWKDAVEIYYNGGLSVRGTAFVRSLGTNVILDDETYMDGFESNVSSVAPSSPAGNLELFFGDTIIRDVRIVFRSSDDAASNPGAQLIGVSPVSFTPASVPEPGSLLALSLISAAVALRCARRRRAA